jgi:hypothetical protein
VKSIFSRLRGQRTELVTEITAPPMGYIGVGPYASLAGEHGAETTRVVLFATLDDAIGDMTQFNLPPISNRNAGVIDSNYQVILSYVADHEGVSWTGTDEGFNLLGQVVPLELINEVVAWRTQASVRLTPLYPLEPL